MDYTMVTQKDHTYKVLSRPAFKTGEGYTHFHQFATNFEVYFPKVCRSILNLRRHSFGIHFHIFVIHILLQPELGKKRVYMYL